MNNCLYITGGLGDCLLYTPLIKDLCILNKEKVSVYVFNQQNKDLLKNNPYCTTTLLNDEDLKNGILKHNQPLFYGEFLPSLSFNIKASRIIAKSFKVYELDNAVPDVFLTNKELHIGKELISKFKHPIIINPTGACSNNKEWYYDRWNDVVSKLEEYTFIQVGIKTERLIEGTKDFRFGYSLREQLSILANSKLYVGVDSFWAHAAAALNVKGVVLFGASTPVIWGHESNVNIYKDISCSPCIDWILDSDCPYSKRCMTSISVDEVVNVIKSNYILS